MPVLRNISYLAVCPNNADQNDIGLLADACLVWQADKILWVGHEAALPEKYRDFENWDANRNLVLPGLVDCHTHLAFAGWREQEFEQRILGKSYLDIAKAGGGILKTVEATRNATYAELYDLSLERLSVSARYGVTTLEAKSGYGLNLADELKQLKVYRDLSKLGRQRIVSTCLSAHTVPAEFKNAREGYVSFLVEKLLPQVVEENLAEFRDVFVEDSAFSKEEARIILERARELGLKLKLHVDQLSCGAGAALAAELGAISADHLEHISEAGIDALQKSNTVAVLLPIASLYTQQPGVNARRLIAKNVPVAIATDFNPGSAPCNSLPLAMILACNLNRLTPAEVIKGVTIYAARALALQSEIGSLESGKRADFCIIAAPNINHWLYHLEARKCVMTVAAGEKIFEL